MIQTMLTSTTVTEIVVITHNDYKAFILRQGDDQLASLVPVPALEESGYDCVVEDRK